MNQNKPRIKIAVIDDDNDILYYIRKTLNMQYDVTWYTWLGNDGYFGLNDSIEENQIQLYILDVNLPNISGYQLGKKIRNKIGHKTPIIYVSQECSRKQFVAEEQRNTFFLPKPFKNNDVYQAVKTMTQLK